jgi:hypothetical protein
MAGCELLDRTVTVQRSTTKTDAGERIIPLNTGAWAVILESRERVKLLFGAEPQPGWSVLPQAEGTMEPNPTKPMTGWRTAWRNLTRTISCPNCGELQKPSEKCRNGERGADVSKVKADARASLPRFASSRDCGIWLSLWRATRQS